jgi:putative ABC transport system substrate-binding protein
LPSAWQRFVVIALVMALPGYAAAVDKAAARLGFVGPESPTARRGLSAFWQRLSEPGWNEGQNLIVKRRWADGRIDRLSALMAEVVARKPDVLVTYGTPGGLAAKNATNTIPIVVAIMGDPIGTGLVTSLVHPGGDLTGLSLALAEGMGGKWLELIQETVPRVSTVAVIGNLQSAFVRNLVKQLSTLRRLGTSSSL